jgi:pimeloyl-ACP methyl ester carboxylesterase
MPFLETRDGIELYFADWGAGPPIVLIHGWPFNSDMWEKQATFLAQNGFRVITYDRRGFGRSEQTWSGYDYDNLAEDLNSLMTELDLREATLVGFSMGGGEVVRYLSRFGEDRVAKAALISAVTPFLLKTADNPAGVDQKVFDEIAKNILKDRPAFLHTFAPQFYGRSALNHTVSESVLEWSQAMGLTGSLRATLETAKAWSTTDFREEMADIDVPVLVVHGTSDATVPIDSSGRRSAQILPNAMLSEYSGEPHGLFLTAADRLNQDLLDFIAGNANPLPVTAQEQPEMKLPIGNYSTSLG